MLDIIAALRHYDIERHADYADDIIIDYLRHADGFAIFISRAAISLRRRRLLSCRHLPCCHTLMPPRFVNADAYYAMAPRLHDAERHYDIAMPCHDDYCCAITMPLWRERAMLMMLLCHPRLSIRAITLI